MSKGTEKLKEHFEKERTAANKVLSNKINNNWLQNEQLYNGVVSATLVTRANFHVPKVFEGVNVVGARIGKLPEIDFTTKPEKDQNAGDLMKASWQHDADVYDLAYLANLSKVEVGLYGRAIFELIPSNADVGFDLLDTMSFRTAPGPIGADLKTAPYCGKLFIYKSLDEIENEAETMGYESKAIKQLKTLQKDVLESNGQEASQMSARLSALGFTNVNQLGKKMIRLTVWYTTISGEKHSQTWADDSILLRDVKLSELGLDEWPFESYGLYPRKVSFWTPGTADILRDPNLALDLTLNQTFDNNTYRNFGMIFAKSGSGLPSAITPRPLGVQKVTTSENGRIQDDVWAWQPPEITSGQATYSMLNTIAESASAMNYGKPGQRGKVQASVLHQEQAMLEQVVGVMKDNYLLCFKRMANRYAKMIQKNQTDPRDLKYQAQKQMTIEGVNKQNFAGVTFIAKATSAETVQENKAMRQKMRVELYDRFSQRPNINQSELDRMLAKEADLSFSEQEKLFTPDPAAQQQQQQIDPATGQPVQQQPGQQPQGQPQGAPQGNPTVSAVQSAVQRQSPQQLR
jgi:hypothetical protein